MSIVICVTHGPIDTDFNAEHFHDGSSYCAEFENPNDEFYEPEY